MNDKANDSIDEKLSNIKDDIISQFYIISEKIIDQLKIVAEGLALLNEKLDETKEGLIKKIDDIQEMMGIIHKDLNKTIDNHST